MFPSILTSLLHSQSSFVYFAAVPDSGHIHLKVRIVDGVNHAVGVYGLAQEAVQAISGRGMAGHSVAHDFSYSLSVP
jgi:hypothetical protein